MRIERLARELGFGAGFRRDSRHSAPFVFVLAGSGVVAALTSATIAVLAGGSADWETLVILLVQAGLCAGSLGFLRAGRPGLESLPPAIP